MQYRRKKPVKPVLRNLITVMHLCKFILTKYAVVDELNAHWYLEGVLKVNFV